MKRGKAFGIAIAVLVVGAMATIAGAHEAGSPAYTAEQCRDPAHKVPPNEMTACLQCVTVNAGKNHPGIGDCMKTTSADNPKLHCHYHPDFPGGEHCRPDNGNR